jgi:hypothetical protein
MVVPLMVTMRSRPCAHRHGERPQRASPATFRIFDAFVTTTIVG